MYFLLTNDLLTSNCLRRELTPITNERKITNTVIINEIKTKNEINLHLTDINNCSAICLTSSIGKGWYIFSF